MSNEHLLPDRWRETKISVNFFRGHPNYWYGFPRFKIHVKSKPVFHQLWHAIAFRMGIRTCFQSWYEGKGKLYATENGFLVHENHPEARWFWGEAKWSYNQRTGKKNLLSSRTPWRINQRKDK